MEIEIEWAEIEKKLNQEAKVKRRELVSEMGEEGQLMRLPALFEKELYFGIELRESMLKYDRMSREGKPYEVRAIMVENIARMEKEVRKIKNEIKGILYVTRQGEDENKITPYMIEKAKNYPIGNLLGTDKNIINCPFHEDKHPSAGIKNNKLHCFTCGETWSGLDIIMKQQGLNFPDAVRRLNG